MLVRILLVFGFCWIGILEAQNNLIIMNETGNEFWLYVNNHKINEDLQSIVKANTIYDDTCHVRVVYADTGLVDFNAKAYLLQNGKGCKDMDFTYSIGFVNKKNTLLFISTNNTSASESKPGEKPGEHIKKVFASIQKQKDDSNRVAENYPAPAPCKNTLDDSSLTMQIRFLKNNHIELNRIKDAKWLISTTCLNVIQTKKVLTVFDYEDSKLKLAEFAYIYLYDKENFMNIESSLKNSVEKAGLKKFYSKKTTK
jgi:hypothetical protein